MTSTPVSEFTSAILAGSLLLDDDETTGSTFVLKGGEYTIQVSGITAETVQVDLRDPDAAWLSLDDGAYTTDDIVRFRFPSHSTIRLTSTGAGPKAWISPVVRG